MTRIACFFQSDHAGSFSITPNYNCYKGLRSYLIAPWYRGFRAAEQDLRRPVRPHAGNDKVGSPVLDCNVELIGCETRFVKLRADNLRTIRQLY